jgi:hypothetical protein
MHQMTKKTYPTLGVAEYAALREYAITNGRSWKQRLQMDWYYGRHDNTDAGITLYGLRNHPDYGPSWLDDFSFPKGALK